MAIKVPSEVLVVEDEPLIRMVAADALAERGIVAWEAGNAAEALLVLEEHPRVGVLFTDVNMPGGMNGLSLAHEISIIRPDVGIVVTSGAMSMAEDLPDHGTFLRKPYLARQMVDLIAEKLETNGH